jgi:hypothetical protein
MERSTINHAKSEDTNPRGQPRSWLPELYARALSSGREEKNSARNFCRLRRQTALWYTLDEDQRTEREVRNCPPKRVRSKYCCFSNFKQLFASDQQFTYSVDDVTRDFRMYVELMANWDETLTGNILRVRHEDIVDDLETQTRRILDFCEIEFEFGWNFTRPGVPFTPRFPHGRGSPSIAKAWARGSTMNHGSGLSRLRSGRWEEGETISAV